MNNLIKNFSVSIVILLYFLCLGCSKDKSYISEKPIKIKYTLTAAPGDGQATLSWRTSTSNQKESITKHQYRKKVESEVYESWVDIPNSSYGDIHEAIFTVMGLTNETRYNFQVRGENAFGTVSTPSNATIVTPNATSRISTIPSAPRNLIANPRNQRAYLTWQPSVNNGGTPISKHQYRKKEEGVQQYGSWEDIPMSAPNQSNGIGYLVLPSLTNGTRYNVQVRAVNNANESHSSNVATVTPATTQSLALPRNLMANPRNQGAYLTWQSSINDGGVPIIKHQYRKKAAGAQQYGRWKDIPNSAPNQSNGMRYFVAPLTNGQPCTFQVRVVNSANKNRSTNVATVTPTTIQILGSPRSLIANPRDGEAYLTWRSSISDGGIPIIKYQYRKKAAGAQQYGSWKDIPNSAPNQSNGIGYLVPSLTNGTRYHVQVRAMNNANESDPSSVTVTPVTTQSLAPPRNLIANPRNGGTYLTWQPSISDGGTPILKHQYRKKAAGAQQYESWKDIPNSAPNESNGQRHWVTLTNGTHYHVQVRAMNGDNNKSRSSNVTTVTPATTQSLAPPRNLIANPRNGGAYLTWQPSISDGGSSIIKHQYRKKAAGAQQYGNWKNIPMSAPNESNGIRYLVTSLTNGTRYHVQVRAMNNANESDPSSVTVTPVTTQSLAFSSPTHLIANPRNQGTYLTWQPSISDGGTPILKHQYRKKAAGAQQYESWKDIPNSAPNESNGQRHWVTLTNGTRYNVQVRAVNANESRSSNVATVTPATTQILAPPRNLIANPRNQGAYLTWQPSTSDGGFSIIRHQYRKKTTGAQHQYGNWKNIPTSAPRGSNGISYLVTSLANGTMYNFQVRAVNSANKNRSSNVTTVTPATTQSLAVSSPTHLIANPRNQGTYLTWRPSTSDGGISITKHQYRKKEENAQQYGNWKNIPTSTPSESNGISYLVTSLANGTIYNFQVRAVNNANESRSSNVATVTPATIQSLASPRNLIANPRNQGAYLTWQPSTSDGGIPITKHQYRRKAEGAQQYESWKNIPNSAPNESYGQRHWVTSLANGTRYSFQVRVVNSTHESSPSGATVTPATTQSLAPPRNLIANPRNGGAYLTWQLPISDGGHYITKHQYRKKEENAQQYENWEDIPMSAPSESNGISYLVTSLTNGTRYSFQVRAVNIITNESDSSSVTVTPETTQNLTFPSPSNLIANPRDGRTFLTWQPPTSDGGFPIIKHQYRKKTAGTQGYGSWEDIPNSAPNQRNGTYYVVTSLTNRTLYTFQVRAVNSSDSNSLISRSATVTPQ